MAHLDAHWHPVILGNDNVTFLFIYVLLIGKDQSSEQGNHSLCLEYQGLLMQDLISRVHFIESQSEARITRKLVIGHHQLCSQ